MARTSVLVSLIVLMLLPQIVAAQEPARGYELVPDAIFCAAIVTDADLSKANSDRVIEACVSRLRSETVASLADYGRNAIAPYGAFNVITHATRMDNEWVWKSERAGYLESTIPFVSDGPTDWGPVRSGPSDDGSFVINFPRTPVTPSGD